MKWYAGTYEQLITHDAIELDAIFVHESLSMWKYRNVLIDAIECLIRDIELMNVNDTNVLH